jgi:type III secretion system FlhB-like substrate exporter
MAALANPKHEAFAQDIAKGKTQAEAYEAAGYAPSEQHASRLARNGKVKARVAELLEKVAKRTEVTVESILRDLKEDREFARQNGQSSAAVAATMGRAKVAGLIIDKAEVKLIAELTDEEVAAELASLLNGQAQRPPAH